MLTAYYLLQRMILICIKPPPVTNSKDRLAAIAVSRSRKKVPMWFAKNRPLKLAKPVRHRLADLLG